jgi:parvulin-like peptidyl-prolyl isomerase
MNRPDSIRALVLSAVVVSAVAAPCGCGDGSNDPPARSDRPASDRVLAEVNGAPIFDGQLDSVLEAARLVPLSAAGDPDSPGEDDPRRHGLDLLIAAELLYQAASAAGIDVPVEELDHRLDVARSQFSSEDEFEEYLARSGTDPGALRARELRRLTIEHYCRTVSDVPLPDDEAVRGIYEGQKERYRTREKVRVAHLLVRVRPDDPPEARERARERIEQAHRRSSAGEPFADLVREYSDSPTAASGGDLGYLPRGRMLPEFERVAFDTPTGQVSPVFETPIGFNLVQVIDREEAAPLPFEQVKAGLILGLVRQRQDRALQAHVRQLRDRAVIRMLDTELAEDR